MNLVEWLWPFVKQYRNHNRQIRNNVWNPRELITRLNQLDSPLTRDVDFWVESTMFFYILEFAYEINQSTLKVEDEIEIGVRGRILK